MGINLEEAINYSKDIIYYTNPYLSKTTFSMYARVFFTTTENIAGYLSQEQFNKKRALTVLAGGDHVFNLISKGVQEIDAFDINVLTYFTYYLRKAMLVGLSYEEFINFNYFFVYSGYSEEIKEKLKYLKQFMPEQVYEYYSRMLEYVLKTERQLSNLYYGARNIKRVNGYLKSEEEFLKLKRVIKDTKVNFYFGDVHEMGNQVPGNYDLILLSNIADYFGTKSHLLSYDEFINFITKFGNMLADNGLLINYLYSVNSAHVIKNSTISENDLKSRNVKRFNEFYYADEGYYRVRRKNDILCL